MINIRAKFIRGDKVKFISHLDLMKAFERAFRRSGLPMAYSQGFNPHPQMVFGLPLSVGVTSETEYADFEFATDIEPCEFIEKLNGSLPDGIKISDAAVKYSKKNIMAEISGAEYDVSVFLKEKRDINEISELIKSFFENDIILAKKEGKAGIKEVNIKPMIISLGVSKINEIPFGYEEFETAFCITAFLTAGSVSNLKPELLAKSIAELTGLDIASLRINRKELFVTLEGKFVSPIDAAVLA